ncbi:MAG TPA: PSD1 and planctomycete cytochrome C domain-containing protein [Pirellulales bacterium]|nr:PSD1 and planctomycete cytochrome C domain-containing protein [Pirellulales bacterium]
MIHHAPSLARGADAPQYNRDVRPILANHCFKCHGPDEQARQAGLRLDQREAALAAADSGGVAIVPGKPDESELVRRICATDPDQRMPPAAANKPLSSEQREILCAWIAAGATYESHWAFVPPVQAPLPAVQRKGWPRNAIDHFVLARLEAAGLNPAPEADKYTLARRLYLDLVGLPPAPDEVDAFVYDSSPQAYEALVDRLLASPHYGERWARRWLDLARYADTNGYEKDRQRSIWPYRDWVINALNADMPFDQFTIRQLAGDLLPEATLDDRIATGFHRNTMLNEEGGIDPLEFRFYAMVDRVNTTGTVWLGLTIGCAQCHTHKYDPIPHADYYRLMAFLNNADEPEMDVVQPAIAEQRSRFAAQIAAAEADLPNRFPPEGEFRWHQGSVARFDSSGGATGEILADGSILVSGTAPEQDTYTIEIDCEAGEVSALRLEAIADDRLPKHGPGRTAHGNFVVSEVSVTASATNVPAGDATAVKLASASADFSQDGFPIDRAIDGDSKTGWAIHGPDPWNVTRTALFRFDQPRAANGTTRWTVRLEQNHGERHTLGRFKIQLGEPLHDDRPESVRRQEHLQRKFNEWVTAESASIGHWTMLRPVTAQSDVPTLSILPDGSVLSSGDQTKRDVFRVSLANDLPRVTALRIEVMPDDSLPRRGPGRIAYEGPFGDFFLSEVTIQAAGSAAKIRDANQSFAAGNATAAMAIDGDPQTGWSIHGGQGTAHTAVFQLDQPLTDAKMIDLELLFEKYYAANLGRFRIWVTGDEQPAAARALPTDIEALLLVAPAERTAEQRARLLGHYVSIAPELAGERDTIRKQREQMPAFPTTLVWRERPSTNPRRTFLHKRGEFLQPAEPVAAELPTLFAALPADKAHDRLALARWLVSEHNPLAARVTVNRHWATLFGRGLVKTTEDFGYQGESPTHPELLDWLAVEFMRDGWSVKRLHKLIVTSATYRQSSEAPARAAEIDPTNKLLAHSPRVRLDAELVRDVALGVSGLLSKKIGGPSVFPPQPPGVSAEGAYGALNWTVSQGEDRYRRGLYTFMKRTAPYAMFSAFDAPSGEACLARREVSNTPLQSLTMLNDTVFVEASQALGSRLAAEQEPVTDRAVELFRRCVSRPPRPAELDLLVAFYTTHRDRLAKGELDAKAIAGTGEGDAVERAAWTLTARAVLNLDETITKE